MSDLAHASLHGDATEAQQRTTRAVLLAVDRLVDDLVRMDDEGAVDLATWPAGARLVDLAEPVTVTAQLTGVRL